MITSMKKSTVLILSLLAVLLLSGCGDDDRETIKWQLPLTAPEDPHGEQLAGDLLPEWAVAAKGDASIMFLETSTARVSKLEVSTEENKSLKDWDVTLLSLAKGLRTQSGAFIDDENVHNPAAFVELHYKKKLIYRGWLYQEFPELFGPDTPGWKLWLKAVTVRAPSEEGIEKLGSLSSAG